MTTKRFSDFALEPAPLDGDKMKIETVLNREIVVTGYRISQSRYDKNKSGKCLAIQFTDADCGPHIVFTGSDVLIGQMEQHGAEIPFITTIKKIDRFYAMT